MRGRSRQTKLAPVVFAAAPEVVAVGNGADMRAAHRNRREPDPGAAELPADDPLFARDFVAFMKRPLLSVEDDCLIPISLAFLESRVTVGLYWLLFDSMSPSERDRLARFYGQVLETYVRETIQRMLPSGHGLAMRVFGDFSYMTGTGQKKTSDIVALYPDTAIFFEVTSARWRMDAARLGSSPDALEEDFDRIVLDKARQLHARIADFRDGRYRFGEVTSDQITTILPVIVTGESVPMWSTTIRATREALKTEALLAAPNIRPLRLIGVEELEMVEPLIHRGGSLLNILESHADDERLRNVSLRNFINRRYDDVPMNDTLMREYERIAERGLNLFRDA
jgi:hypothetical protein